MNSVVRKYATLAVCFSCVLAFLPATKVSAQSQNLLTQQSCGQPVAPRTGDGSLQYPKQYQSAVCCYFTRMCEQCNGGDAQILSYCARQGVNPEACCARFCLQAVHNCFPDFYDGLPEYLIGTPQRE